MTNEDLRDFMECQFAEVKSTLKEINGRVRATESACAVNASEIRGLWSTVRSKAPKVIVGIMGGAIVALISMVLFKLYGVTL